VVLVDLTVPEETDFPGGAVTPAGKYFNEISKAGRVIV
jgi:hypothetical protein